MRDLVTGSLAVRLMVLACAPSIAAGAFAASRIDDRLAAADTAAALATRIDVQSAIAEVYAPAQRERIALEGLAQIDQLGLPRSAIVDYGGVDYVAMYEANVAELEAVLDALDGALAALPRPQGWTLPSQLRTLRRDLSVQRWRVDHHAAEPDAIEALFERLNQLLARSLDTLGDGQPESVEQVGLSALAGLLTTAADQNNSSLQAIVDPSGLAGAVARRDVAEHAARLDAFEALLDGPARAEFDTLRATWSPIETSTFDLLDNPGSTVDVFRADVFERAVAAVSAQTEYVSALGRYSRDFHRRIGDEADADATLARAAATATALLVGALAALTAGLVLAIALSTLRPLRQLTRRAEQIGAGLLDLPPLPRRGPSDVRTLTEAVNEMLVTLRHVDVEVGKLASGSIEEVQSLPGTIGVSVRDSVKRLAAMLAERARFEATLSHQARHDALTGLPNRHAVIEHLEALAEQDRPVAVLFIDLDGFKGVNDSHGHANGDAVLREVAARLRRTMRADTFVGRLGGDEFVVITNRFRRATDMVTLGTRLIHEIEQPYECNGQYFVISASVGVSTGQRCGSQLLGEADSAVYQAKRRGRGRVETFSEQLQQSIERAADLEMALRQAVRYGEFSLYLQPVAALPDGLLTSAEALIRWDRPDHGMVPPAEFIPVAEQSGLIVEIERWVLHIACQRLADWAQRPALASLKIAVNVSGRHLTDGDLVADVESALAATGANPRRLQIELTETHLMGDLDRATAVLDRLRTMGIEIAVDDFGTGYSSLTYLRHLPIDAIKIDQSFISRATEGGYDATVVDALLTIGRTLGIDVVAEGVETGDQYEFVKRWGFDRAQGFLIARPMPIDEAEAMLGASPDGLLTGPDMLAARQ